MEVSDSAQEVHLIDILQKDLIGCQTPIQSRFDSFSVLFCLKMRPAFSHQ